MVECNKYYSYNLNELCDGCKKCVEGRKTVFYITGVCPRKCYYCPLSEQKKDKDVMYANERKVENISEVIDECKLSGSEGIGITGGDPLCFMDRTVDAIVALKNEFGKKFHIHLYTSLDLIDSDKLKRLYDAGLDEIRVHPDLEDEKLWNKIKLIADFDWKHGIEIPAIPTAFEMIQKLIDFSMDYIDFMNLNEFEYSDMNEEGMHSRNMFCRDSDTYAIGGSHEMAIKLLDWVSEKFPDFRIHYCTAKLKDATQIANRLKIRAQNIAKPYDVVDEEGMLIRGVIKCDKPEYVTELIEEFEIPEELIEFDSFRNQILIAGWVLQDIASEVDYECQLVTEYPTSDRMIVEVDVL